MTRTTGVYDVIGWLDANRGKVICYAVILAVAVVIVSFFIWQAKQKEVQASHELSEVLDPLKLMGFEEGAEPSAQALLDLAARYPGTSAGARALLLGAGASFSEGKYAEAQARFEEFLREYPSHQLRVQAQLGMASTLEALNRPKEAIEQYQAIINRHPSSYVLPQVKFELALLHQEQGDSQAAFKLFQELARPDVGGAFAGSARLRIEALLIEDPSLLEIGTNSPAGTAIAPAG